ncbi:hypothetical protein L3V82_10285 [Thiotrichales bacterium 19S3-7]|nr:hypothetical protein [Thiotrichales bacterium 19S3-7]MCF6802544.1 hypothetical protein [Thiotrichales bacterium 19S3-11]
MNKSIEVKGKSYLSIKAFLTEHGFSRDQFNKKLNYDDGGDRYVLAAERLLMNKESNKLKGKAIPVTVNGINYKSIAQACRALNLRESRINKLYKKGLKPEECILIELSSTIRTDTITDDYFNETLNHFLYKSKPLMERLDERQCILQANDRIYWNGAYQEYHRVS